jgi:hypothetical protein
MTVNRVYQIFVNYLFKKDSGEKDFTKQVNCCTIGKTKRGGVSMEEKTCLKCGRACSEKDSFCEECLADMKKYPVKPGTVVQLPKRREITNSRKTFTWRKNLTPEEQIRLLNRRIRRLWGALILSGLLTAAAIGLAVYLLISFATKAWHITWVCFPIIGCINGLSDAIIDLREARKHEN